MTVVLRTLCHVRVSQKAEYYVITDGPPQFEQLQRGRLF
jgi:hypothetical protein